MEIFRKSGLTNIHLAFGRRRIVRTEEIMTKNNSQTKSVPDDQCNTLSSPPPTSCFDKMRITWSTFKYSNILCCFKLRKQTDISILEYKIEKLKRNFGLDYLTLVGDDADVDDLKECLRVALEELDMLQK